MSSECLFFFGGDEARVMPWILMSAEASPAWGA
jgi:hypothetical protein